MNKRAFYWGALWLVIAALIMHGVARRFLEESMHRKAARISEASKQHTPYVADPLATQVGHAYNALTTIGIVFTGLSVVCMVTASIRREPGWYLILLLLIAFATEAAMLL
jgi:uncharacterized membrane protein YhaH (DUF805 family)